MNQSVRVQVPLTKGKVAYVSLEDAPWVLLNKWHAAERKHTTYARRNRKKGDRESRRSVIYLHRAILPDADRVDHKDGDGLNNTRENVRACTQTLNLANMASHGGTSKYRGVHRDKWGKRWVAQISIEKTTLHLGTFDDEDDAARAWNAKAKEAWGEFAKLNDVGA